jgi:hypothetical protein
VIPRSDIEAMFENMTAEYGRDVSAPMVWEYFFTHSLREPLEQFAELLRQREYEVVDIHQSVPTEGDDSALWWLHVQRIEVHSVDTLCSRNEQLTALAEHNGIDAYDGMDVGPDEQPPNVA